MKYLVIILVVLVTGCATSPNYSRQVIESQEEGRYRGAEIGIISDSIGVTRNAQGYQIGSQIGQFLGRRSENIRRRQLIEGRRTHMNYPMGTPSIQEVERYYSQFDDK